jgi:hypothetical protein
MRAGTQLMRAGTQLMRAGSKEEITQRAQRKGEAKDAGKPPSER